MSVNANESSSTEKETSLDFLNLACTKEGKPYLSFKKLPIGEYYVENFKVVDTQYGTRVRVDLADSYMILPERFAETLTEDMIKDLNQRPKVMEYAGVGERERLVLAFREVGYTSP